MTRRRRALLLIAAFALGGCAAPRPPAPAGPAESVWSGRFAVRWLRPGDPPAEESAAGRFTLRETDGVRGLEVYSPLGQTLARATDGHGRATLETATGARFEADSPEALTEQALGWRAPVSRLPDWLRTRAPPDGAPQRFLDAGWEVLVDAWADGRPQRLTLRWPATAFDDAWRRVAIRLVLDP